MAVFATNAVFTTAARYICYMCKSDFSCSDTYTVDGLINGGRGLYPGGLIPGIIYSFENGWAYIRGGGLKVGFYGMSIET